jgi:D-inositol-3-phosphate glycosyltransferase
LRRVHALADDLGVAERIRWVPPQPHDRLADYYRAADVCEVPSRSE